jgi:hypothetical protein
MPSTDTITTFYSFTARTQIKSAEMNNNFSAFRGHLIAVDGSLSALAVSNSYDLGSSSRYWRAGYITQVNCSTVSASTIVGTSINATTIIGTTVTATTLQATTATVTTLVATSLTVSSAINLTGGQIAYPSARNASADPNTQDEYEEGNTAVTLTASTGTITLQSTQDTLSYTKIGRFVNYTGQVVVASVSAPTGSLILSGLAFACQGGSELSDRASPSLRLAGLTTTATGAPQGLILAGGTSVTIERYLNGNETATAAMMQAGSSIIINISYIST